MLSNPSLYLFIFPEPSEAPPPRQGDVSVLCADTPGTALHAVLRGGEDGHEASREHGGGWVRLPLSEIPENLLDKGEIESSRRPRKVFNTNTEPLRDTQWTEDRRHFTEVQPDTGTEAAGRKEGTSFILDIALNHGFVKSRVVNYL